MPTRKIRVAVIGGGNMGKNHLRNYFNLREAELVGLADINPDTKSLAKEFNAKFYTSYKLMLDELKLDAVSIVVPTPLHAEIAEEAFNKGINVLLEKPITTTVEEADYLIQLAQKKKLIFTVGHIEHFNPLVLKLKKIISTDKLGEITSVVCKRVGDFPKIAPKTDVIVDLAVHDIGIINFLLDDYPKHTYSHQSRTIHPDKVDAAEILLDYGQASGFIQANWTTPVKIRTISVTGTNGYIEGNYLTQELVYYKHNLTRQAESFAELLMKGEPTQEVIPIKFKEPLLEELQTFLKSVQLKKFNKLVRPEDAREALKIALQATGEGF